MGVNVQSKEALKKSTIQNSTVYFEMHKDQFIQGNNNQVSVSVIKINGWKFTQKCF